MADSVDYLLVPGMHRSGTSLLAHLMVQSGYSAGKTPLPPAADNPNGFFENRTIKNFHDVILSALHSSWKDVRCLTRKKLSNKALNAFSSLMGPLLKDEFEGQSRRLIKDPRMCRLMPLWSHHLKSVGACGIRCIIPIRHPMNVASSLHKRDGFAISYGLLLWIQNVLAAERDTRGLQRMFLVYDDLLCGKAAPALAGFLGMREGDMRMRISGVAIPSLRHEVFSAQSPRTGQPLEILADRIWTLLHAHASEGENLDGGQSDLLWREYLRFESKVTSDALWLI